MQRRYVFIIFAICVLVFITIINNSLKLKNGYGKIQLSDDIYEKQCYHRSFKGVLLLINFNFPYYDNLEFLKDLYGGVFDRIVSCGPLSKLRFGIKPDLYIEEDSGHRCYKCMALAMKKYPGHQGYIFANDDMVVNWWTMVKEDRNKIWHGTEIVDWRQHAFGSLIEKRWVWWKTNMGVEACQQYYNMLKTLAQNQSSTPDINFQKLLSTYLKNSDGEPRCGRGWSDFYYIPGKFSKQFIELSSIAYMSRLYHEIAVHNILRSLDSSKNIRVLNGLYLPDVGKYDYKAKHFWKFYNHHLAFVHPYKFHGPDRYISLQKFKERVLKFKDGLIAC